MQRAMAVALVLGALAMSGCFSELLPAPSSTTIAFICAVLDPADADRVILQSWVGEGVALDPMPAVAALRLEVARLSGRDAGDVRMAQRDGPPEPRKGWNDSTVQTWGFEAPFLARGDVTLRILWVDQLGDGNQSGSAPAAGTIALSESAIVAGALRLNRTTDEVARAVLLHFAGHALGVVNRGIPVQDPDIQEREGPAQHDPDPASVLNVTWEDARTMAWAANATYDAYPDDLLRDWAAATTPGGACL